MSTEPGTTELGRTVLVLRAVNQARPLLDALRAAGLTPVLLPLIEVVPPADGGAGLRRGIAELANYDWLVLTSPNAVRAVAEECEAAGLELPSSLQLAAIGATTAKLATRLLAPPVFVPSEANARCLAAELPLGARGVGSVLAPLAELASSDLVDGLTERGAKVWDPAAYRTIVPKHTPAQRSAAANADAVLFTSGSTVDRFVDLGESAILPDIRIAIGPVTAEHMDRSGIEVTAVAEEPSPDGLVAALLRTLSP